METVRVKPGCRACDDARALCETAFPPEEQLPFDFLLGLAERDNVRFEAYYDEGDFCGITFSAIDGDLAYLGYLATCPEVRSRGYGSRIIEQLRDRVPGKTIVLEIESLDEQDAANYAQRLKRKAFYERNGFRDAGLREIDGGIRYDIMVNGRDIAPDELQGLHDRLWEGNHSVKVL